MKTLGKKIEFIIFSLKFDKRNLSEKKKTLLVVQVHVCCFIGMTIC